MTILMSSMRMMVTVLTSMIMLKMGVCQEWELEKEAEKVLAKGSHLAEVCSIHLV